MSRFVELDEKPEEAGEFSVGADGKPAASKAKDVLANFRVYNLGPKLDDQGQPMPGMYRLWGIRTTKPVSPAPE